jgi:hypothetical protein
MKKLEKNNADIFFFTLKKNKTVEFIFGNYERSEELSAILK